MLIIFSCTCWPSVCLWKNVCLDALPIFNGWSVIELYEFYICFANSFHHSVDLFIELMVSFAVVSLVYLYFSVQLLSRVRLFAIPWTAACQVSLIITTLGACSSSCPLSWLCHPTTSSSVIPFSCLQSFPASGSFPVSQFFASGG